MVRWTMKFALIAGVLAATFSVPVAAQEESPGVAPAASPEDEEYRLMKLFVDSLLKKYLDQRLIGYIPLVGQ